MKCLTEAAHYMNEKHVCIFLLGNFLCEVTQSAAFVLAYASLCHGIEIIALFHQLIVSLIQTQSSDQFI